MEWNPFHAWKKAGEMAALLKSQAAASRAGAASLNPDRTPEEVDVRTRAARQKRLGAIQGAEPRKLNAHGQDWLSRDAWVTSIDDPSIQNAGTWAKFEYVDADGVITDRHIRQWSKRGAYIEGFCMEKRASRLFRQDRISNWISR
ncbi:hypothetical protein [Novosphingobium rosa]|uniref:hypothetical protein n=1 Tax=Novosphingobium rosa TaxID=76978 RepID=UPI000AEC1D95|nr:hypothetical protein [Novosphingobium rosa]